MFDLLSHAVLTVSDGVIKAWTLIAMYVIQSLLALDVDVDSLFRGTLLSSVEYSVNMIKDAEKHQRLPLTKPPCVYQPSHMHHSQRVCIWYDAEYMKRAKSCFVKIVLLRYVANQWIWTPITYFTFLVWTCDAT